MAHRFSGGGRESPREFVLPGCLSQQYWTQMGVVSHPGWRAHSPPVGKQRGMPDTEMTTEPSLGVAGLNRNGFPGRSPDFRARRATTHLSKDEPSSRLLLTAPSHPSKAGNGRLRFSFPVTVAGLFRIRTGFPILPPASNGQPPVTEPPYTSAGQGCQARQSTNGGAHCCFRTRRSWSGDVGDARPRRW